MGSKLASYAVVGLVMTGLAKALGNPFETAESATRATALQSLAGVGAAVFTVQIAALALLAVAGRGDRISAALARSRGAIRSSLSAATLGAGASAVGFSLVILTDSPSADAFAAFLCGVLLAVLVFSTRLVTEVLGGMEKQAADWAQEERQRTAEQLFSDG